MTPSERQAVLNECFRTKVPVLIASSGIDIAFQTKIKQIDGATVLLENMVRPEFIRRFTGGERFFLQCKMLRLQTTSLRPQGLCMAFAIQADSVIEETRQAERFLFSPEEKVIVDILNPFDEKTRLKRHVLDMSATGLSLYVNASTAPFSPGTKLNDLQVSIDGKPYRRHSAEVVYNRRFMDMSGRLRIQVGLKFIGTNH